MTSTARSWRVPAGLIALGAIPIVFGTLRVVELLGGPETMPVRERFVDSPVPVVLHIVCAIPYVVLGALQFSASLRRRRPAWHRRSGRLLVPLGLVVALSALWMNQFYVDPEGRNELLYVFRLGFGTAMVWSIILGLVAVRRRDFARHRVWMTRAYAIALGAGTQTITLGFGQGIFGTTELTTAVFQALAWVINLAVAEWGLRRPTAASRRRLVLVPDAS
jgi:uncharacterized membrane protein